jgi:hypothetical protein
MQQTKKWKKIFGLETLKRAREIAILLTFGTQKL